MQPATDNSITQNLTKQKYPSMTSKREDICRKFPFKKITKCEEVIDYKIIREIHCKIQANASTIQSELVGGQHGLLGMEMQPATYRTIIGKYFSTRSSHHKQLQCQLIRMQLEFQGTSSFMQPKYTNGAK